MIFDFCKDWTFWKEGGAPVSVTLPHDAMLLEKRDGGCRNGVNSGYFPGGKYTYEKTFELDAAMLGKSVVLHFEGVYQNSKVYANGTLAGSHRYGYTAFDVDISDFVQAGENTVRVEVDNSLEPNCRWYSGSGIYRPVQLLIREKNHITQVHLETVDIHPAKLRVDVQTTQNSDIKQMFTAAMDAVKNHKTLSEAMTNMFFLPEDFIRWNKGTLAKLDDEAKQKVGNKPLFITEWNSMAVFGSPVHDEKYSAAFAIKSCMDLNHSLAGYMFWCCSDIYEEQFMLPRPFVGGFGLVSNDGIPKPNFWGFKMLSQLYAKRLDLPMRTNEAVEYAAFVDGDKTQVLLVAQDQDYYKNETHNITIEVNCEASAVTVQSIDDTHCNPKAEWVKLGCPDNLKPVQVAQIKETTRLKPEQQPFIVEGGITKLSVQLCTNDVLLITLT